MPPSKANSAGTKKPPKAAISKTVPSEMTRVKLISYFDGVAQREKLPPAITIEDVYMPPGITPPIHGLTAFYGVQSGSRQLVEMMKMAEQRKMVAWPLEIELLVRPIEIRRLRVKQLKEQDIVNLSSLSTDSEAVVQNELDRYREDDGLDSEDNFGAYYDSFVTRFPQRLERLVLESPYFKGVKGVMYHVPDQKNKLWRYISIWDRNSVSGVTSTCAINVSISLPEKLPSLDPET